MAELVCIDGSVLAVCPVPVLDRGGTPYEATLRLQRDGAPFGDVGERCAARLAETADRLRCSRLHGPDSFPEAGVDAVLRALDGCGTAVRRALPRDRELLALRARDPDDLPSDGELRVWLREQRTFCRTGDEGPGGWSVCRSAVVDAWGSAGTGLRAVLDSAGLMSWLDRLVDECTCVGALDPPAEQQGTTARPTRV